MPDVVRRILIAAALVAAALIGWYAYRNAAVGSDAASDALPDSVDRLIPRSGSQVLRQDTVGIDLATGYDAYLDINGTTIRNTAATPEADGLRKNLTVGLVEYVPGPGKRIPRLAANRNCVVAYVWSRAEGPQTALPVSWCFTAT